MRLSMKEIDNRDGSETWVELSNGSVLELHVDEVKNILESFFVNQVQDECGKFSEEKFKMNNEDLVHDLDELYSWVQNLILECGYDISGGHVEPMIKE